MSLFLSTRQFTNIPVSFDEELTSEAMHAFTERTAKDELLKEIYMRPIRRYLQRMAASLGRMLATFSQNVSYAFGPGRGMRRCKGYCPDSPQCSVDATNVELAFCNSTKEVLAVRIDAPNGDFGTITFSKKGVAEKFVPQKPGKGHGAWTVTILKVAKNGDFVLGHKESIHIQGVGTLNFIITEENGELKIKQHQDNSFLIMSSCKLHGAQL